MTQRPKGTRISVLVVDDQTPFRRAARHMFEAGTSFEVVGEAETGEEAVALAAALRPQLVLMDVVLPDIDGVEATRRILTAEPSIVVVLASARRKEDLRLEIEGSGAAAFLRKEDVNPAALQVLIAHECV